MSEAQRLADYRRERGLEVRMVSPQQVFMNSRAGTRDATAIKRYMRNAL
jgi:transposase